MGSNFILGALIQSQALSFGAAMAIALISGTCLLICGRATIGAPPPT